MRLNAAGNRGQRRRLSRAIGSDDANDLALLNLQGDPAQCNETAIIDVNILQLKHVKILFGGPSCVAAEVG